MTNENSRHAPLPVAISACLLGEKVRYDGGHKANDYLMATLGRWCDFQTFCPEAGAGLGIPRPPVRLVGDPEAPRAVGVRDPSLDVTEAIRDYATRTLPSLEGVAGVILKNRSPSCGMARVKVYREGAAPRMGRGLFADALLQAMPWLPVEEEGRLGNPVLRDNFLERLFCYRRWQLEVESQPSRAALVGFHSRQKMVLLAHGAVYYRQLGQLVAEAGKRSLEELLRDYRDGLMAALRHQATPKRQANVLHHLLGYLKRSLSAEEKQEMLGLIDEYRRGELPLIAPLTLLQHHFRRHPHDYVMEQAYLWPSVAERQLRLGPG